MPPPKPRHGLICGKVTAILVNYVNSRGGRGSIFGNDTGFCVGKNPDTVRGIDVAFFLETKSAAEIPDQYFETPPDLAVEVRSEGQPYRDLQVKTLEYIQFQTPMVWIVDPTVNRLTVFEPDREPVTYAAESDFDGGDVLPGLRFRVAQLFS